MKRIAREREGKRREYMKGLQVRKKWAGEGRGRESCNLLCHTGSDTSNG